MYFAKRTYSNHCTQGPANRTVFHIDIRQLYGTMHTKRREIESVIRKNV